MLMCWKVKEGRYDPPPPLIERRFFGSIQAYFTKCFKNAKYNWLYVGATLWSVSAIGVSFFGVFFAGQNLGLSFDQYGKIIAAGSIFTMSLLYPLGWLCDKISPLIVNALGLFTMMLFSLLGFFCINGQISLLIFTLLAAVSSAFVNASNLPMYVTVFPKDNFGQFFSAYQLISCIVGMFANVAVGKIIDLIGNYRYIYVWSAVFAGIAGLCIINTLRNLKNRKQEV